MARKIITVQEGQSLWDIAIQEYGGIEAVRTIEEQNPGVSRSLALNAGQKLLVEGDAVDAALLARLKEEQVVPVTASKGEVILSVDSGFSLGFSIGFKS